MTVLALFVMLLAPQSPIVPAGTRVDARLDGAVQTAKSSAGDVVTAVLTSPIRAAGQIVVPEGSRLDGRVETIESANTTNQGRVRLVFREIRLPDGRSISTWITNSFSASVPNRNRRYLVNMSIGGVAGALIGGKAARTAGILGGVLVGFVIASDRDGGKLRDLELKAGQVVHLQLQQDLSVAVEIRGQTSKSPNY